MERPTYITSLNDRQQEAVIHTEGPLLIIAGAGAGKTKTVTHRILHLIHKGVPAEKILAITFTNKAAGEMRERVHALLGTHAPVSPWGQGKGVPFVSTFHALCAYILREQHALVDLPKHFTIADQDSAISFIKESLAEKNLDPKQWEPKRIAGIISREKGLGRTVTEYESENAGEYVPGIVSGVWKSYERILREHGSLDFDDMLAWTVRLLKTNASVRAYYEERFHYIHVDEYQDTNGVQYDLSKLLAGARRNICVVGDMDQSIYSWRGADFRNLLNFERDYPEAKIVLLEQNYRSTKTIIAAANEIIKKNAERKDKRLFTEQEDGEHITAISAYDENHEARIVSQEIKRLQEEGVSPSDIAILYRANFQSRALEEALIRANIPYHVLGVKFFERKEVKDILAYIRLALNPKSLVDMKRVINVPPRGIGKVTFAKISAREEASLPLAMQQKLALFNGLLESIRVTAETKKVSETILFVLKEAGIESMLKGEGGEGEERLANIYELAHVAEKYDLLPSEEGIVKLLEDASLASDQDSLSTTKKEEAEAVRLMTVHASKGLEFPYVFVTGLEQDLFPHSGMGGGQTKERKEEERRLFYVAVTRAGKKLFLSYASFRTIFGQKAVNTPSEFLLDIPEELVKEYEGTDSFGSDDAIVSISLE